MIKRVLQKGKRFLDWLHIRYNIKFHYPQRVSWEFTTYCNLDCVTCARHYMDKLEMLDMPRKLFESYVDNLHAFDVPDLFIIAGLGEPTLCSNFSDYLHVLRKHFPSTTIKLFTNTVLLDRYIDDVLECVDVVVAGVNYTKTAYARFTSRDLYGKTLNNLKRLLQERNRRKSDVTIVPQLLETHWMKNKEEDFIKPLKSLLGSKDKMEFAFLVNMGGWVPVREYSPLCNPVLKYMPHSPCWQVYSNLYFGANGDVYPCCVGTPLMGELCLGNLHHSSLRELVNNGKLSQIKEEMATENYANMPQCSRCNVWKVNLRPFIKLGDRWV